MRYIFLASSLLALLQFTYAVANIAVANLCGFDIYYKPDAQGYDAPIMRLTPGEDVIVDMNTQPGNAYKLSSDPSGANPIQFDYSVSHGTVYYDVSDVAGHPFHVTVEDVVPGGGSSCRKVGCNDKGDACRFVAACPSNHNFIVWACPH
jgi:hypothetical protein